MDQTLYELLNDCVVLVKVPAISSQGTGFFVASDLILTCTHVVDAGQKDAGPIEITWHEQTYPASIVEKTDVDTYDLALLQVSIKEHPCVLLQGGAEPFAKLYSYGYPDLYADGASTTFKSEGWVGSQKEKIKFQSGQVSPGMSGSPILNLETGCCVCGIIQWTRDRYAPSGGLGLLAPTIYQAFPALEERCKQFHQRDKHWLELLTLQQRRHIQRTWQLTASDAIEIFFSYAPEDEELRKELAKQLKIMQRLKLITNWYEDDVSAGGDKAKEVTAHLGSASIILLLISPDFVTSDYKYEEMLLALDRHKAGMVHIIPILMRPTFGWKESEFGHLLAIPRNGKPVVNWRPRDDGFYEVAKEIRLVVEDLRKS